jgi:hypothetical protein
LSKDYPWYTPYQFAGNKPIWAIDLDGLEEMIRTDFYNAAGRLYRTEIQVIKGTEINGQILHQCNVTVDNAGNATCTYINTRYGNSLPGGVGSNLLRPNENAGIWNVAMQVPNTTPPTGVGLPAGLGNGSLTTFTRPDSKKGEIITGSKFTPLAGIGGMLGGVANGYEYGTAEISNTVGDPDYNGMYVWVGPAADIPIGEPYTPAGINTVPNIPGQRIDANTGQPFAMGNANSGGTPLSNESTTATGCVLSGDNDNTTSFNATNPVINVPARAAVGSGNASTVATSGTITLR